MDKTVCVERYGSSQEKISYCVPLLSNQPHDGVVISHHSTNRWTSFTKFLTAVFLPQGYPESVSKDYLEYQIWDTIQAFCSSITGTLATQAVLQGVGVGDENASVLAATVTWILKDGMGMLGRILFAWMQGSYLDSDCKRWRLFADILNDCAIFLEILAPHYKSSFRLIVCVSGIAKSIVGVAGGATRAALTQHQARRNNMADVSAKDGSQETLVNLAALVCSLLLMPIVTGHEVLIWSLFLLFTGLHLYANYKAVTAVCIEAFNQTRLHIASQNYLDTNSTQVPPVSFVNKQEPVVWALRRKLKIQLGVSLQNLFKSVDDLQRLTQIFSDEKYLLNLNLHNSTVYIALHADATTSDHLKACFHAELLEYALVHSFAGKSLLECKNNIQEVARLLQQGDAWSAIVESHKVLSVEYARFQSSAQNNGWNLEHALLSASEWRAVWDIRGLDVRKEV